MLLLRDKIKIDLVYVRIVKITSNNNLKIFVILDKLNLIFFGIKLFKLEP